jgi:predicted Zn-dependent protease
MHVTVVLLGEAMSARKIETEGIGDNVLGRAARETARAYIFMKRLEHAARRQGRDFNAVLGRVLAHEVGHLLLPGRGHSNRGIMRDTLDSWSARGETFTPSQRQQIQMRLSGRSER